jgi:hypothetical protein
VALNDPAHDEIEGFNLADLTVDAMIDSISAQRGMAREHVSPEDIAEFMVNAGATHRQLAQVFDDTSLQRMAEGGLISEPQAPADPIDFASFEPLPQTPEGQEGFRRSIEGFRRDEPLLPLDQPPPPDDSIPVLSGLGEALGVDGEVNTAPAFIQERADSMEYTEGFMRGEFGKAGEAITRGDMTGFLQHGLGALAGGAGRMRDSIGAEMQVFGGRAMAAWQIAELPGHENFFRQEEIDELNDIGRTDNVRKVRNFWNDNAHGWPWMAKGLFEGAVTLSIELMMRGPKIPWGPVKSVFNRVPLINKIGPAFRGIPRDQKIRAFENEIEATLGSFVETGGGTRDPNKVVDILTAVLDPDDGLSKFYELNGALRTSERIQGALKIVREGIEHTRTDPVTGVTTTIKQPLPRKVNLEKWRKPPVDGSEWSLSQVIADTKNQLGLEYAQALGYKGPRVKSLGLFRYMAAESKNQLGYAWLFLRPGFAALNYVGGSALIAQQQGLRLLGTVGASRWVENVSKIIPESLIFGPRTRGARFTEHILGSDVTGKLRLPPVLKYVPLIGDNLLPWNIPVVGRGGKVPGLGGAIKWLVRNTEQEQHRLVQTLTLHRVGGHEFSERVLASDLPQEAKHLLINAWKRGEDWVFDDDLGRTGFGEMVARLGRGERIASRPADVMANYADGNTRNIVDGFIAELGPDATDLQISFAMHLAMNEVLASADKAIAMYYRAYPGSPGHQANELLTIFRATGAEPDANTMEIFGHFIAHEREIGEAQARVLDGMSRRLANFNNPEADDALRQVGQISNRFDALRAEKGREVAALSGQYVKGRAKDATAAGEAWEAGHKELMTRYRDLYHSAADEMFSDEMVRAYDQAFQAHYTALTAGERGQVVRGILTQQRETLQRLQRGLSGINAEFQTGRKSAQRSSTAARVREMAGHNARRMKSTRELYRKVSADAGIELPSLESEFIGENIFVDIVRAIDNARGDKILSNALLEDSVGTILRAHATRQADLIGGSIEGTVRRWSNPERFVGTKTVAEDLAKWRHEALTVGREQAESASNEALFSYIYNNFEVGMQAVMPYPYWGAKFMMFQARQAVQKPGQLEVFGTIMAEWLAQTQDLPPHLVWTVRILTLPNGDQIRIDPKAFVFPMGQPVLEIIRAGEERDPSDTFGLNVRSTVMLLNLAFNGAVYPHLSLIGEGLRRGEERLQETTGVGLSPQLREDVFGDFGLIPPVEQAISGLGGSLQRLGMFAAGAGDIPFVNPEDIYNHGLTPRQRNNVGQVLADMAEEGEISQLDAEQAILDIQEAAPNEIALEAMMRWSSRRGKFARANWPLGGIRDYPASYQESRKVNMQYRELRAQGRTDDARALLEAHPGLPVRWMIRDELDEQEKRVAITGYWDFQNTSEEEWLAAKAETDVMDTDGRTKLDEAFFGGLQAKREELELTDDDLSFGENVLQTSPTGVPFFPGQRKAAIRELVAAYRDMVQIDDFKDEAGDIDFESYTNSQRQWREKNVREGMLGEFEAQLAKNVTLPEAIYRVYQDTHVSRYFSDNEDKTTDEREEWLADNPTPKPLALAKEVQKRYPGRWEADAIVNKLEGTTLGIEGYLDVSTRSKIERVRRGTGETPYTFRSPSGRVVNQDSLGEFIEAFRGISAYTETKPDRRAIDGEIDRLQGEYRLALARLTPMQHALGEGKDIRMKYMGDAGEIGLVGIARTRKEMMIKRGDIAPWTDVMTKYYTDERDEAEKKQDALRSMIGVYFKIRPEGFVDQDGVTDWKSFYAAQDRQFSKVAEIGASFGVSESDFRRELDKNVVPSQAAWRYWQEAYIQPALDARSNGLVTRVQHIGIQNRFNKAPLVRDVVSQILQRFPHLKSEQFASILNEQLPNFSMYWTGRGYSVPRAPRVSSGPTSTLSKFLAAR